MKKKGSLREMIALDKARMLPLNFWMNYLVKPLYVLLSLIVLAFFGSFLQKGEAAPCLLLFGILVLLTAGLLYLTRLVRKKAVASEMKRYHIKRMRKITSEPAYADEWDFSDKELSVKFNRFGMVNGGRLFYYNHLKKAVLTDNQYRRVNIMIVFVDMSDQCIALPLSEKALKMLDCCQIKLENQETLDYILDHPEDAFLQIYDKSEVNLK